MPRRQFGKSLLFVVIFTESEIKMTFCTQCQTYLSPDAAACPACNAPRPPAEPITAPWSAALDAPPADPPLALNDSCPYVRRL